MSNSNNISLRPINSGDSELLQTLFNDPIINKMGFLSFPFPTSDIKMKNLLDKWLIGQD